MILLVLLKEIDKGIVAGGYFQEKNIVFEGRSVDHIFSCVYQSGQEINIKKGASPAPFFLALFFLMMIRCLKFRKGAGGNDKKRTILGRF
jgi:hypothetical protein